MIEKTIKLSRIEDVKKFVEASLMRDFDIDLISGKYVVDGKSIMGIFSLDLTSPIVMRANCENDAEFMEIVSKYTID